VAACALRQTCTATLSLEYEDVFHYTLHSPRQQPGCTQAMQNAKSHVERELTFDLQA